ncbi:MAG TPA: HD domain-containing phosphohydrolase [Candidatus Methylacidiphilales bacterium]
MNAPSTIPPASSSLPDPAGAEGGDVAEPQSRSLLIVHDDEEVLRRLTMLFNGLYTVAFAETLSQALNLVRQGFRAPVVLLPGDLGEGDHPFLSGLRESLPESFFILLFREAAAARVAKAPPFPGPFFRLNLGRQVPELIQTVRLAFQQFRLRAQNRRLQERIARQEEVRAKIREEGLEMGRMCQEGLNTSPEHLALAALLGRALGEGLPQRDLHATNHPLFVAMACDRAAEALGFDEARSRRLLLAALLHDIGKMVLPPEAAWADPATLSGADLALYESHVLEGVVLLEEMGMPRGVVEIVAQHHERPDGEGFPGHLPAAAILPEARLIAMADAYHHRVHRLGAAGDAASGLVRLREEAPEGDPVAAALAAAIAAGEEPGALAAFGQALASVDWGPLLGDPLAGGASEPLPELDLDLDEAAASILDGGARP